MTIVVTPHPQSKVVLGRLGPVVVLWESRWNPTGANFDHIVQSLLPVTDQAVDMTL